MKKSLLLSLSFLLLACTTNTTPDPSPSEPASIADNMKTTETDTPAQETANTASQNETATLRYTGVTQDLVPAATGGGPDGKGDHSFELTTQFENEVLIKDVTLSRIENGQPNGVAGWTTSSTRQYWILKVRANGTELNGSQKTLDLKQPLSGRIQFEFYGSDAPGFNLTNPGTEYELVINYKENNEDQSLSARVTL